MVGFLLLMLAVPAAPAATAGALPDKRPDKLVVEPIAREDTGGVDPAFTGPIEAAAALAPDIAVQQSAPDAEADALSRTCLAPAVEAIASLPCLSRVAQLKSVRYLLVGVARSEVAQSELELRLFDARSSTFVAAQAFQCSGVVHADLPAVAGQLTRRLLARAPPKGPAVVRFEGPQGQLSVDGLPGAAVSSSLTLAEGTHTLRYAPEDRAEGSGTFDALAGETVAYSLWPAAPDRPIANVRKPVGFPWADLAIGALGGGVVAATIVGAGYVNGDNGQPNLATVGSALVDVGLFVGIGGIAYAIGRIADRY